MNSAHRYLTPGLLLLIFFAIYLMQLLFVLDNRYLIDDSFIYLRYVRNVSQGLGFVWNPGGQPIEGFTSFFYLLILVLFERLGLPATYIMPTFSMFCSLLVLTISWRLAELLNPNHKTENLLSIMFVGLSPIFLYWNTTGMDISFFSVLLILTTLVYINHLHKVQPAWLVGCMFALTSLARPEGVYLFITTLLFDYYFNHRRIFQKSTFIMALVFVMVFAPILMWRWIYFGYPLPNTYYAKTAGIDTLQFQIIGGAAYLGKSLAIMLAGLGIPFLLLLTKIRKVKWKNLLYSLDQAYVAILIFCSWGGIVASGGDHFMFGRFLMPSLPLISILVVGVGFSAYLKENIKNLFLKTVFLTLLLLITVFYWQPWAFIFPEFKKTSLPPPNASRLEYFASWHSGFIAMGKTLQANFQANQSIAAVPIGAIGYYSNLQVMDMVGLVDLVIAHEPLDPNYAKTWRPGHDKGDGLYILSKEPDYIQFVDRLTSQPLPGLDGHAKQYKSIVEIWESPEFHKHYEYFPIKTEEGWYYNLYRRIDGDK